MVAIGRIAAKRCSAAATMRPPSRDVTCITLQRRARVRGSSRARERPLSRDRAVDDAVLEVPGELGIGRRPWQWLDLAQLGATGAQSCQPVRRSGDRGDDRHRVRADLAGLMQRTRARGDRIARAQDVDGDVGATCSTAPGSSLSRARAPLRIADRTLDARDQAATTRPPKAPRLAPARHDIEMIIVGWMRRERHRRRCISRSLR